MDSGAISQADQLYDFKQMTTSLSLSVHACNGVVVKLNEIMHVKLLAQSMAASVHTINIIPLS